MFDSVVFTKDDLWLGNRKCTLEHRGFSAADLFVANDTHHVGFAVADQAWKRAVVMPHAECTAAGLISVKMSAENRRWLAPNSFEETGKERLMSEITQFIALPIDQTDQGFVPGEAFKCASPASAIERAKGFWKVFGHAGAVAIVRTGYPDTQVTVLRRFGSVPDELIF